MKIKGYVVEADKIHKRLVYVYPIEHHYEDQGEEAYIKYGCPICEYFGNKHTLLYGISNCSICGVNLKWKKGKQYKN